MENHPQPLVEQDKIIQVIQNIFIYTDERNWEQVKAQFDEEVVLDYTSMSGGETATITPQAIIDSWKDLLPGFQSTQHMLSNFTVAVDGDRARASHYGTAWHYLPKEEGEDVWIVVGIYDHHLVKTGGQWKVNSMTFNFKFMDGNQDLPRLARENISE